jgi:hypothetical protein
MGAHRPLLDQVFILRFWREDADASDRGHWRVMVRNVNTRRRDVVDDMQGAFAIVAADLNEVVGEKDSGWVPIDHAAGSLCKRTSPVEDIK